MPNDAGPAISEDGEYSFPVFERWAKRNGLILTRLRLERLGDARTSGWIPGHVADRWLDIVAERVPDASAKDIWGEGDGEPRESPGPTDGPSAPPSPSPARDWSKTGDPPGRPRKLAEVVKKPRKGYVPCPVCQEPQLSRGLRNHVRNAHQTDPDELLGVPEYRQHSGYVTKPIGTDPVPAGISVPTWLPPVPPDAPCLTAPLAPTPQRVWSSSDAAEVFEEAMRQGQTTFLPPPLLTAEDEVVAWRKRYVALLITKAEDDGLTDDLIERIETQLSLLTPAQRKEALA